MALELSNVVIDSLHRGPASLTLSVGDGETVALCGPPKFGGTALARVIAGLSGPLAGQIHAAGRDITHAPPVTRPVGFVPVDGGLLPQLTLDENITYGARLADPANSVLRGNVERLAKQLDLQSSLTLRPHEVSAGQRVRAAVARAALRQAKPAVLVIDATTGARGVAGIRRLISRVWDRPPGISVVLLTRDSEVIEQVDRFVWLEGGEVVVEAPLDRIRAVPPSLAIAELVLPGPVAAVHDVVHAGHVDLAGLRLPVDSPDGRPVIVVLTPSSIEVTGSDDDGPAAKVLATSWDDGSPRLWIEPAGRPGERWPARAVPPRQVRPHERVTMRLGPGRIHTFDPLVATGTRVAS